MAAEVRDSPTRAADMKGDTEDDRLENWGSVVDGAAISLYLDVCVCSKCINSCNCTTRIYPVHYSL